MFQLRLQGHANLRGLQIDDNARIRPAGVSCVTDLYAWSAY